jgi:TrmH family RNA methyltransferase
MSEQAFQRLARLRVVLVRPSHPGNIGSAARAMKTMGLSQLWLVAPARFPDPEAAALASGAQDVLAAARVCASLQEAVEGCALAIGSSTRRRDLQASLLSPEDAAVRLLGEAAQADVALLFGNETFGLSREELSVCQALVSIPANPEYSSLNLAAAVQVMAYVLRRTALHGQYPDAVLDAADLGDVERFYADLEQTLTRIGFLDPAQPRRLMPKLRRLFARTRLEKEELNILRGWLAACRSGTRRDNS